MKFDDLARLPTWALYMLIVTTLILSVIILGRIWFPMYVDAQFFWKVVWSYVVLMASAGVVSKIADLIKHINSQKRDL